MSISLHTTLKRVSNFSITPRRKYNLNNACSNDVLRKRVKRYHESEEQIAARNVAQRIRTGEIRRQESREQRDERLRHYISRTRAARERHIIHIQRKRQRVAANQSCIIRSPCVSNMHQTLITLYILKLKLVQLTN